MARPVRSAKLKVPAIPSQAIVTLARTDSLTPLGYMLSVMNDRTADRRRRDRLAIAAAPYCHPRVADSRVGKKDQRAEAANNAGADREWFGDLEYLDRSTRQ